MSEGSGKGPTRLTDLSGTPPRAGSRMTDLSAGENPRMVDLGGGVGRPVGAPAPAGPRVASGAAGEPSRLRNLSTPLLSTTGSPDPLTTTRASGAGEDEPAPWAPLPTVDAGDLPLSPRVVVPQPPHLPGPLHGFPGPTKTDLDRMTAIQAQGILASAAIPPNLWQAFDATAFPSIKRKLPTYTAATAKLLGRPNPSVEAPVVAGNKAACHSTSAGLGITGKGEAFWAVKLEIPLTAKMVASPPIVHVSTKISVWSVGSGKPLPASVYADSDLSWQRYAKHGFYLTMGVSRGSTGTANRGGPKFNRISPAAVRAPGSGRGAGEAFALDDPLVVHVGEYQLTQADCSGSAVYVTLMFGLWYQVWVESHEEKVAEQQVFDHLEAGEPKLAFSDVYLELRAPSPDKACRWVLGTGRVSAGGTSLPGAGKGAVGDSWLVGWTCHGSERIGRDDQPPAQPTLPHKTTASSQVDLALARGESDIFQVALRRVPVSAGSAVADQFSQATWRWRFSPWQAYEVDPLTKSPKPVGLTAGAVPKVSVSSMAYVKCKALSWNSTYQYNGWVADTLHGIPVGAEVTAGPGTKGSGLASTSGSLVSGPFKLVAEPSPDVSKDNATPNVPFLFEVEIPRDMPPASVQRRYRTTVTLVDANGTPCLAFTLEVTVHPFSLPEHPGIVVDAQVDTKSYALFKRWWEAPPIKRPLDPDYLHALFKTLTRHGLAPRMANGISAMYLGKHVDAKAAERIVLAKDLAKIGVAYWRDLAWDTGGVVRDAQGNVVSQELSADTPLYPVLQGVADPPSLLGSLAKANPKRPFIMLGMNHLSHWLNADALVVYYGEPNTSTAYQHAFAPGVDPYHPKAKPKGGRYGLTVKDKVTRELTGSVFRRHVQHLCSAVDAFFPGLSADPNRTVLLKLTGEGGYRPKISVLERVEAMTAGLAADAATRGVGRMGLQNWHPGYGGCNWWYFSAPGMPFEPLIPRSYELDSDKHKCIYDNSMTNPQVHPMRLRLFFWRLWKEGFESYAPETPMSWTVSVERQIKVPGRTQPLKLKRLELRSVVGNWEATKTLLQPPRIDGHGDLCETHRLKLIHRAVQDHAYLSLLDKLRASASPGSTAAASAKAALGWVDRLIWRLPEGGGMGTDHPYQRDARELERARRAIADAISALSAGLHSEPETRWKQKIGPQIPAAAHAHQAAFGGENIALANSPMTTARRLRDLTPAVAGSDSPLGSSRLIPLPGPAGSSR